MKEKITVLDNLRPEEVRFDFDPLNKNLCFLGGTSLDPTTDHSVWNAGNWSGMWDDAFGGGGGDGEMHTSGGLSAEDEKMKALFYDEIKKLFDKKYQGYEGDRYADRSQGELDLLKKLKGGGDYKGLYDTASTQLGFGKEGVTPGSAADVYKQGMSYGTGELATDTAALMGEGSTYRDAVADTTTRQMNEAATKMGMINRGHQIGGGTAWGDRAPMTDAYNKQGHLTAGGDVLGKMNLSAYNTAVNNALNLRAGREGSAGRYSDQVMQNLGIGKSALDVGKSALDVGTRGLDIGTRGLDKQYSTALGAFGKDRGYLDRDLGYKKKMWDEEQNFPFKKLQYASGIYGSMPFEEKVVTNNPGSGGK